MDSLVDRAREQLLSSKAELQRLQRKGSYNTQLRRHLWEAHGIATPQPLKRLSPEQRQALKEEIHRRPWMDHTWWGEIMGCSGSTIHYFISQP